eukprot:14459065-Ditylum_brightwellii.AAC.1
MSPRQAKEKVLQLSWSVLPCHGQVQLCTEPQKECAVHTLHCGTAEAPAGPVCEGCQKASQKRGPKGKEVKDLNAFVRDKIKETSEECDHNMHGMSDFKDLSISSSDKSIQSIIGDTSVEGLDNNSCKLAQKK